MWGSTFADLAKRATELQEQASHLAVTQSLFNLDGLQPGKSGDEQDHPKPTTTTDGGAAPNTTTENAEAEKQQSTPIISSLIPTVALYAEDKVVGSLVIPESAAAAAAVETNANSNFSNDEKINANEKVEDAAAIATHNSGKDGWEEEEDVEEFDFDSSPKAEPVFDESNKEEIMESMLSQQEQQTPVDAALPPDTSTELKEPSIVSDVSVADENAVVPSQQPVAPVDAPKEELVSPSAVGDKEEPTINDAPTEENVEELDDEVVFSEEDDGLDDMYDDDDDEVKEGDDKINKQDGDEILENEKEIADMQAETPNDEALSPVTTNQHTLTAAGEELTETTTPSQDRVETSVLNENQSNSGVTPIETDENLPRLTSDEKEPTATAEVEPSSPSDEPLSREAIEQEKAPELVPEEFRQAPTSVGDDTIEPIVGDQPAPASESTESTPVFVDPAPSERALPESPAAQIPVDNSVADRLLEQFSQQMQRLDENHQAELRERDQQHALELEKVLASFNHDQCEEQRRDMEERLLEKLRTKEEQLMEILKTNEGHKLKIDVLKRELDGTRQLLAEKESAVGSVHAARESEIRDLERKLKQKDAEIAATKERYENLSAELKKVKDELESTNDSYSTLKGRVKVVATELKDRRVECRNLGIEVAELTESNEGLKTQLANLQSQLADQNRSQSEKDEELEQLRTNLAAMEDRLKVAEKSIKEAGSVNEKALASYKKKAQSALAEANARSAAASQAREEAELEARAARSTADAAMERARVAEARGKEALAEAKSYVKDLEEEKVRFEEQAQEMQQTLTSTVEQLNQVRAELDESRAAQDKLSRDLEQMCRNLEAERAKSQELEEDLSDSRRRANELHDQLETFREELQRSSTASFGAGTYSDTSGVAGKAVSESSGHLNLTVGPNKLTDKSDAEATIIILQQELHDANRAIRELKDTLRVTIEQQAEHAQTTPVVALPQKSNGFHPDSSAQGNDSTPLYYAMEKQAELNLARDEINRLANLLGDAESSKMEAYEAMDEMRRKMEEAQSRLKRFEKMGSAAGRGTSSRILNQAFSPRDGNHHFGADELSPSHDSTRDETVVDSAVVNLEYLKNVMLSYLNAKTLQEKKSLVPVIGAVLCLTAEEQTKALKTIEDTGGIEGVGQALLETFGSGRLF